MAFSAFERMMAWRYLRARRQEGFISVIAGFSLAGIALGVATLIVVLAVMSGFQKELLDRILGVTGHLSVMPLEETLAEHDRKAASVRQIPGVTGAYPVVEGQVMVTAAGPVGDPTVPPPPPEELAAAAEEPVNAAGALVRGIRPQDLADHSAVARNLIEGDLRAFTERNSVLIGSRIAQRLDLALGDRVTLMSPEGRPTAFGTVPRVKDYRIAGIFQIGMYEYDNSFVFMPLQSAQAFFGTGDGVSALEVRVTQPADIRAWRAPVFQAVDGDVRLVDWRQQNDGFFNMVQTQRNVLFLILAMIVVVAAFNIISSLIMLVKDKGRDIAILRTMGASGASLMRIFFMTGSAIGVVGTFIGLGLGVAFAANIETIRQAIQGAFGITLFDESIYFLSELPGLIDPVDVASVCGMALGLAFLATLYPAWRASRVEPAEMLRGT